MSDDSPDMDLIERVQRARMIHDAQAAPSQVDGIYWIEAKRGGDGPGPTARAGYWLVLTDASQVDALWARIRAATEAGQLGYKSKVATASRSGRSDERRIHVLTYDADDAADVARVRAALTDLGIAGPLRYNVD